MTDKNNKVRAIGLLSGGLDSMLATRVLMDQGIEILAISFISPFFGADRGRKAAAQLGVDFRAIDFTSEHLPMVQNPPHGYGKNMNPCIDCHAMMLRTAGKIMDDEGFDFLFTGEVLGQRPMSQNRSALDIVAKDSGRRGHILRPMCAKHLDPTIPEQDGRVDRERLLDIHGRSRKPQMALAEQYGITDYPSPAGGCSLTDPGFSKRLRDLVDHSETLNVDDIAYLKVGRQFRLTDDVKLIVGRDHAENVRLREATRPSDALLAMDAVPGPCAVITGPFTEEHLNFGAAVCLTYSNAPTDTPTPVELYVKGEHSQIEAKPVPKAELDPLRV